jgi:multiple sugar transport system ATP-binding protein
MVFQNYALYPHMTVYKNMAFGLKLRGESKAEIDRKVREAAQMLGITALFDRKPKQLSGGQRQRVAVGRAIVRNPKAFLFDEPLSNLDAKLRVEMRAELKKLHRRLATTTIYVTHDQEEAMTLGDRIVVMKDGVVHQVAHPLKVYDCPANRFVAGFVGTPPMNFLEGRLARDSGRLYFEDGWCRLRLPERLAACAAGHEGRPMTLGVRPEGLSDRPGGAFVGEENSLRGKVTVVEPLGDRMDLHIATPAHERIVCRVDAHREVVEGMDLMMHLDMARVHLFEPGESGRNVSHEGNRCGV